MPTSPSSISPDTSSSAPSSAQTAVSCRFVKRLRKSAQWEAQRAQLLAQQRARRHQRQTRQLLGWSGGALTCVLAIGLWIAWPRAQSWPVGQTLSPGVDAPRAPLSLGSAWLFAGSNGTLWKVQGGKAKKIPFHTSGAAPRVLPLENDLLVAGGDGTLARLDAQGRERWRQKNGNSVSLATAPVATSALFAGADERGVWARDPRSGALLWRVPLTAPPGDGLCATPFGIVVPLLGNASSRGGLRCLSPRDGKTLWRFPLDPLVRASGTAAPRFDAKSGRVFWCNDEGLVVALDAHTGHRVWKTFVFPRDPRASEHPIVLRGAPVVVGKGVIVGGGDGGVRAFNCATGQPLWTRWLGQPLSGPLLKARLNGRLVVLAGSAPVVAMDARSGEVVQWLGSGAVAWNGRGEFAASDEDGSWHFWRS